MPNVVSLIRPAGRLLVALVAVLLTASTASAVTNLPVCTALYDQFAPSIIPSGSGGQVIAWVDFRQGDYDIYAQKLDALGNRLWGIDGVPVSKAIGIQSNIQMIPDGAGGAFIVWQDERDGSGAGDDIYVQRMNSAGVAVWFPDGLPVCDADDLQEVPRITADGSGGIVIAWSDRRYATEYDVWAQRLDAAGTLMWPVNGVPLTNAVGDQREVALVSDGLGGAIGLWRDHRNGEADLFAQRLVPTGAQHWTLDGVPVSTAAGDQKLPVAVADGLGGVVVAWSDTRNGNHDVFAQRLNGQGVSLWAAAGVTLCAAVNEQTLPRICSDNANGAIVTWQDLRGGTTTDIYAARATASGTVPWTANGVAVCNATLDQVAPAISSDPNGGAVIAWTDNRSAPTGLDIYVQHLSNSGTMQWTTNGVTLANTSGAQDQVSVTSDGLGGASISWRDFRSTVDTDIYGVQVDGNGSVVGQCPASATVLVSDAPVSTSGVYAWYDLPIDNLFWTAVGVRSASGSDHDVEVYAPGTYGLGTYPTCFLDPYAGSYAGSGVDFVIGNFNDGHTVVETYGARVTRYGGSGSGSVEWELTGNLIETDCTGSTCGAVRSSWTGVIDVYDVFLAGGQTYTFTYTKSGSANMKVMLFGSGTTTGRYLVSRTAALWETSDKYHVYTAPRDDFYGLVIVNDNGLSGTYQVKVDSTAIVGVGDAPGRATRLGSFAPNPTQGASQIHFSLAEAGAVSFRMMDMAGRVVATIPREHRNAGSWSVRWDGRGRDGRELPPGLYFVQMELEGRKVGQGRIALVR